MSDLNRDEFEVLFSEETAKKAKPGQLEEFESIGGFALVLVEAMKEDRIGDTYRKGEFAAAWWAWQASRECLVIELPNRFDEKYQEYYEEVEGGCFNEGWYVHDVHAALTAAGVKYK